jgi:allophanate hydrolase
LQSNLSVLSLRESYRNGKENPVEVISEVFGRIRTCEDPAVWISTFSEAQVKERATALMSSKDSLALPLYGVPFAIKDNIDCAGLPTTAGCPDYSYVPQRDSTVVSRLTAAGSILIGKTNLDQFATGLVGTRSPYGIPRCVFNKDYISGGSSSGSAKAVAGGLVAFSLGTDTAGSGRIPAAFNNIVGLKPSRGLISTTGVVPACRSLDCVSIFANTPPDAALVLSVARGFDPQDPYSRQATYESHRAPSLRIGILAEADREFFGNSGYDSSYRKAIERFVAGGAQTVQIDFSSFREAGALLYGGPWVAERYAAIRDFVDRHESSIEPTVRGIITRSRSLTAAEAFEGQYRLSMLKRYGDAQMSLVDALMLPTAPTQYKVSEVLQDPVELNKRLGTYTNFVNLLDYCALAIPAGFTEEGLPFGVSLIAPAFSDGLLVRLARLLDAGDVGPTDELKLEDASASRVNLFVIGAHMSGMPLNHELTSRDGYLVRAARTVPEYKLYALPDSNPARPGLVKFPESSGHGIEGEIWSLSHEAIGELLDTIPSPLALGKAELEDGSSVTSFLCESFATKDARDITAFGGWRAYQREIRSTGSK